MGKKSKTRQSEQRAKVKRARKEAQRAVYQSYKNAGTNKKSKRGVIKSKRARKVGVVDHPNGRCYNHGCRKCQPMLNDPAYATNPASCLFGRKFMPRTK